MAPREAESAPIGGMPTPAKDAQGLLDWYKRSRRQLPWRQDRDPYRVWVSEVMLQQTGVEVVVPYYERFIARFPTVGALGAADLDEVLGLWSGLGYYRRARQLHAAARKIVASGGRIPDTPEGLERLPGIGPYTAAAVASIAYGAVEPALDGNVERVVARLLALDLPPKTAAGRRRIKEEATRLLDPDRPGDSNQALMELGATVCRPRRPACSICPLTHRCVAARQGRPESYPHSKKGRGLIRERRCVVVAGADGRVVFFRRPADSRLLTGFWELPWAEWGTKRKVEKRLAQRYGGQWRLDRSVGRVRHTISHRAIIAEVRPGAFEAGHTVAEGPEAAWLLIEQLEGVPISSLDRKTLSVLGAP